MSTSEDEGRYRKVDLETLSTVLTLERESDALTRVQDDLCDLALATIFELQTAADTEPNRTEAEMLRDQARGSALLYIGFVERRIGKILNYASIETAGSPVDKSRMSPDEMRLFNALCEDIKDFRSRLLRGVDEISK